jgi:DNA topoisomerase-2
MPPKKQAKQQESALTQRAHVLKRPDMYVGSALKKEQTAFVYDSEYSVVEDIISFSPAQERVVVEAFSNITDVLNKGGIVKSIDAKWDDTWMSIQNNGSTPPVVQHLRESEDEPEDVDGMWVPQMIFGKLMSGSNFDDDQKRMGSGRNGVGVSLLNIFSNEFIVEIGDSENEKHYTQTWTDNMKNVSKPKIKKYSKKVGFVKVSWNLDFSKFGETKYTEDFVRLVRKHLYDVSFLTNLPITVNDEVLRVSGIDSYAQMYFDDDIDHYTSDTFITGPDGEKSRCLVALSSENKGISVSFVNGVYTSKGGVHVDNWKKAIFVPILKTLNTKHPNAKFTLQEISELFCIFYDCKLPNPAFTDQSKHELASPSVKVTFSKYKTIQSWELFKDKIQQMVTVRDLNALKKTGTKKKFMKVENHQPANMAGGAKSLSCELILTEGLSAQTFADKGMNGDHEFTGTFALRGKFINVRKANVATIQKNKEVVGMNQALGLEYGVDYTDETQRKKLNYGSIRILCDSDVDGYHIEALLMNYFHYLFPSLLYTDFIRSERTPILRITQTSKPKAIPKYFFTKQDYLNFMAKTKIKVDVKYYKGLGTHSDADILKNYGVNVIDYSYDGNGIWMRHRSSEIMVAYLRSYKFPV